MPTYRDKVTGQTASFDHEPSQQELETHFGVQTARPDSGLLAPSAEQDKSMVAPGLGGLVGGIIGGKTPLGKLGAGIGAAAGTGYGDLYNMLAHGVGDTTPSSEAQRLATVGGLTSAAEVALPPILRGVGALKNFLPKGVGSLGPALAGYATGHTGLGVGAGAAIEAAPQVANGIDWLGTPAGTGAGNAARDEALANLPPKMAARPDIQAQAQKVGNAARMKAGGPLAEVPDYLKQENWGATAKNAGGYIKGKANAALEGLQGLFGSGTVPPPPSPPSPGLQLTKTPGDIAERLGVTGQHVSSQPDISRNPEMKWNADVTAAPQRTPSLTQTSPTDPSMPWEEHASRSNPKRTGTGGQNWSTPPYDPNQATPPGTVRHGQDATAGPALSGLANATPAPPPVAGPSSGHDFFLQRWIEGGGTPETYARAQAAAAAKGGGPNFNQGGDASASLPFGPNTVGAAQSKLPQSVNEAEGMSLAEQNAWEAYKASHPGTTDAHLDDWFTTHGGGANPNEGLDLNAMADKLTSLLRKQ